MTAGIRGHAQARTAVVVVFGVRSLHRHYQLIIDHPSSAFSLPVALFTVFAFA